MLGGCFFISILLVLLVISAVYFVRKTVKNTFSTTNIVRCLALSPDGTKAFAIGSSYFALSPSGTYSHDVKYRTLWEWDTDNQIPLTLSPERFTPYLISVWFSQDSTKLAILYCANGQTDGSVCRLTLYDTLTGKLLWENGEIYGIESVAFSDGGENMTCAAGSSSGKKVYVLDMQTGNILHEHILPGLGQDNGIVLLSDGKHHVVMDNGARLSMNRVRTIGIYDNYTREKINEYNVDDSEISHRFFPPLRSFVTRDGDKLVMQIRGGSSSQQHRIVVFSIKDMKIVNQFSFGKGIIYEGMIGITPDSRKILIAIGTDIHVVELSTGKTLLVFDQHTAPVGAVAFSPDSKYVLSAGDCRAFSISDKPMVDSHIYYWDINTGKIQKTLDVNSHPLFQNP